MQYMNVIPYNRERLFFIQKIHSSPVFPEASSIDDALWSWNSRRRLLIPSKLIQHYLGVSDFLIFVAELFRVCLQRTWCNDIVRKRCFI